MTIDDILKIVSLTQAEINALSDKDGLYKNSDTGNIEYNGSDVGGGGTPEAMEIINVSSTDVSTSVNQASPSVLNWDIETEKDSGFTHDNVTNNSRIEVGSDGTYKISANIRMESAEQRAQFVANILIDGVAQPQPYGSSYIRNNGNSSDFWTCIVNPPPLKLTAGQYVEVQIQIESQTTTAITGTFIGTGSSFSMINLQGTKGEKGDTGAGSNIVVKRNGATIGTVTDVINFITSLTITDSGSNETEVNLGDMLKSVYDTTGVNADAFDYANAIGLTQVTGNIITENITSDEDNYNPTNFSTSNVLRLNPTGQRDITGFDAPPVGVDRIITIVNTSSTNQIKFKNNSSSSLSSNRILMRDNGDKDLKKQDSCRFWYDHLSSRWRSFGAGAH